MSTLPPPFLLLLGGGGVGGGLGGGEEVCPLGVESFVSSFLGAIDTGIKKPSVKL